MLRKIRSLVKKCFVTLIFLLGSEAFTAKNITIVVMKKELPIRALTESMMSPLPSESPPAAMAEKTSGAPLPRARRVTPAKDSEQDSLSEIRSRAGERYESAVDPKLYIAITRNKILNNKA